MLKLNPILFFLVTVLCVNACRCKDKKKPCQDPSNPDCENYDPCNGKKTINTFFRVRPGDRGFKPPEAWCNLIQTDTFSESSVRFDIPIGNPNNSTYEWQIGSEPMPRIGNGFEVDFSNYLRDNGWERHIPVTLFIRTPMNECLHSEEETVKVVKRNLYFTESTFQFRKSGENPVKFKGFFVGKENDEVILQSLRIETGEFRGIKAPFSLLIGIPFQDTLLTPRTNCPYENCQNYIHYRVKFLNLSACDPYELTGNPIESETIFLGSEDKIKRIFKYSKPTGIERYEFIGERIE